MPQLDNASPHKTEVYEKFQKLAASKGYYHIKIRQQPAAKSYDLNELDLVSCNISVFLCGKLNHAKPLAKIHFLLNDL